MTKRDVRLVAAELHFEKSDGWTWENLLPLVDAGELQNCPTFYRLAHKPSPACFNVERLTLAVDEVLDHRLEPLKPVEKTIALKYRSQHGVFLLGDNEKLWRLKSD